MRSYVGDLGVAVSGVAAALALALGAAVVVPALAVIPAALLVFAAVSVAAKVRLPITLICGVVIARGLQGLFERAGIDQLTLAVAAELLTLASVGSTLLQRSRVRIVSAAVAYVAVAVATLALPAVPSLDYGLLGLRGLVLPVLLGAAVAWLAPDERERRVLYGILTFVVMLNCILALRQVLAGFTAAEAAALARNASTYNVRGSLRPLGAQLSNQDFGLLVALATPAATAAALQARGWHRVVFGLVATLSALAVLVSLLRSALLAAVVGVAVAAATSKAGSAGGRLARASVALALLATFSVVLLQSGVLGERGRAVESRLATVAALGQDVSFNARLGNTLPSNLAALTSNPLGLGPGGAGPISQARPVEAPLGPLVPDNGFLIVALQMGLLGLGCLVALLLASWRRSIRKSAAASAAVAALVIAMLLGGYWSLVGPMSLFFVFLGATGALGSPRQEGDP